MSTSSKARELLPELVRVRRHLHMNPELSFAEYKTQAFIMAELKSLGLQPQVIGKTGVVVDIGAGARCVALRADIDALPIQEEAEHSFVSQNDNVMHACGHDAHTAILLGVARMLVGGVEMPGKVRLMFQPAEETPPGGALDLIAAGVLEGVDRVLGLHVNSGMDVGKIGGHAGVASAYSDRFEVVIEGKGGHGSAPHTAVDPIVVAADVIMALQTVISRSLDPRESAVITVGTISGGANYNIIAPRVSLTGTVRTFSATAKARITERMPQLIEGICQAYGAKSQFKFMDGYPSLVNTAREVDILRETVEGLWTDAWVETTAAMGGEDFSYYLQHRPGVFLKLGVRNPDVKANFPGHHPQFNVDEEALAIGVTVMVEGAKQLLMQD